MIELRQYQETAIEELKTKVNEMLKYSGNKVCVFKSPTGSGKTIMTAEFLKRLVLHSEKDLAFIWISVNQLHDQSRIKLENYYEDTRIIKCSEFEDLEDKTIGKNEILFFNWQSINKEKNIFIRENEQDNNLTKIVENTKEAGREIILIIDESHHTAKSEKSIDIIEKEIAPKVTIEVSATPKTTKPDQLVSVDFDAVKNAEMIKKEVAINPDIDKNKIKGGADKLVIDCALKKRDELLKAYKKEGSNINPLVLIQLPDKKTGVVDKKEDIISILSEFGITIKNKKLAVYLSDKEDKINLTNIEKEDNETEVLIFKQAIALGWDCPRAAILVLFRDWKSLIFSIQTIGRIMRMPELKHYKSEVLNKGYAYTNLSDIEIAEDIAKDYITIYQSRRRNDIYQDINLQSIYIKRQRAKTRLSGQFSSIFLEVATNNKLKENVNLKPTKLMSELMIDGRIEKLDQIQIVEKKGDLEVGITERELQYRFDLYIKSVSAPFAPADSSGRIKTAIYKYFINKLKIKDETQVQMIVLSQENNLTITNFINMAKKEYIIKVVEEVANKVEIQHEVWNVPEVIDHNSNYDEANYSKSIMKPQYIKSQSKPEIEFTEILENKKNNVEWWFKNGESEIKYFAVHYKDIDKIDRAFYVDFIIKSKDGRIGLFDTKSGFTAKETTEKAEALQKYISEQNQKHKKKLWGGIIVQKDGSFRLNQQEKYSFSEKDLNDDWEYLVL